MEQEATQEERSRKEENKMADAAGKETIVCSRRSDGAAIDRVEKVL